MERFTRKIRYNIRIENAFKFMSMSYPDLKESWFKDTDIVKAKTIEDVYAITLCKVVEILNKRGLYREYIRREDVELSTPKGKINLDKSISNQTTHKGTLICSYDEFSEDIIHNQIIKSTLFKLLRNKNISKELVVLIQKTLNMLNGISIIDVNTVDIKRVRYNNSNIRYKTAIKLCKYMNNLEYISKISEYNFEDKLYTLFCNSIYLCYSRTLKDSYIVEKLEYKDWESNNKFEKLVDKSRTYTVVKNKNKVLILGYEMYNKNITADYQDKQLRNLKSLCDKYEAEHNSIKTCGCIIYVNSTDGYTDKDIQLLNVDNRSIAHFIVDCNIKYNYIDYKLKSAIHIMLDK